MEKTYQSWRTMKRREIELGNAYRLQVHSGEQGDRNELTVLKCFSWALQVLVRDTRLISWLKRPAY